MAIRPANSWVERPIPDEPLPTKEHKEIDRLKAELRVERNAHAATRDALGETRNHLRRAKSVIGDLRNRIDELRLQCQQKDSIIRQLEDLKL